jgi:hypothetical protein
MENYILTLRHPMFDFEPVESDYYKVLIDSSFYLDRKIFSIGNQNFTKYEKDIYISFKELFQSNKIFQTYLKAKGYDSYVGEEIINNMEKCLRYLNIFSHDIYLTMESIQNMLDLMDNYQLKNFKNFSLPHTFSRWHLKSYSMLKKILTICDEKDRSFRPNIKFNFNDACTDSLINGSNISTSFLFYINWIQDYLLIPGKVEQFNIFLDINDVILFDSKLPSCFLIDFIKLTQFVLASRINKIFIYDISIKTEEILAKYIPHIFQNNICKIVLIRPMDLKSQKEIDDDVNINILEKIFDPKISIQSSIFKHRNSQFLAEKNLNLVNELYKPKNLKICKTKDNSLTDCTSINSFTGNFSMNEKSKNHSKSIFLDAIVDEKLRRGSADSLTYSHNNLVINEEFKTDHLCRCKCIIF